MTQERSGLMCSCYRMGAKRLHSTIVLCALAAVQPQNTLHPAVQMGSRDWKDTPTPVSSESFPTNIKTTQ